MSARLIKPSRARLPGPRAAQWDWQERGACRACPEMFFTPDRERGPGRAFREQMAKQICADCPVIEECLRHALSVPEPYGVWGGLSESEREALTARRLR